MAAPISRFRLHALLAARHSEDDDPAPNNQADYCVIILGQAERANEKANYADDEDKHA